MTKELFVSSTPHETKVGLVEDDQLAEVYLERENEYTLAGSIYKGRVTRVLPGMQSAFVDIGLERDAFLYVSDFMELQNEDEDLDEVPINSNVSETREKPQERDASEPEHARQFAESMKGNGTAGGRKPDRGRRSAEKPREDRDAEALARTPAARAARSAMPRPSAD